MTDLVFKKNEQVLTTSRNIARDFGKRHDHVLRDIDNVIKGLPKNGEALQMFYPSTYIHEINKQEYKQYLINRDGFTLLVMGFTGDKAMEFKLKYIEAFNEMEQQLTKPKSIEDLIILQAQSMKDVKERLETVEKNQSNISEVMGLNKSNWRDQMNKIINTIARNNGGTYKQTRRESYSRLEGRARCDLERRLKNKLERLERQGVPKRTINSLNYMDVIADEDRLIEIYIAIVKEMAIEHGVEVRA